jgi:hypothetical protein
LRKVIPVSNSVNPCEQNDRPSSHYNTLSVIYRGNYWWDLLLLWRAIFLSGVMLLWLSFHEVRQMGLTKWDNSIESSLPSCRNQVTAYRCNKSVYALLSDLGELTEQNQRSIDM